MGDARDCAGQMRATPKVGSRCESDSPSVWTEAWPGHGPTAMKQVADERIPLRSKRASIEDHPEAPTAGLPLHATSAYRACAGRDAGYRSVFSVSVRAVTTPRHMTSIDGQSATR